MATSGTYLFNPNLARCVDEAFERIGKDPAKIKYEHIESARRSINFLLVEWATVGITEWKKETVELPLVAGTATYSIPANTMDILYGVLRYDGTDTWVQPLSKEDYLAIPVKNQSGRPDRYMVDRKLSGTEITFWTIPDLSDYTFVYDALLRYEDAGTAQNTPDIPYYFEDAFVDGLAAKLARKYARDRLAEAIQLARDSLSLALSMDGDNSALVVETHYGD